MSKIEHLKISKSDIIQLRAEIDALSDRFGDDLWVKYEIETLLEDIKTISCFVRYIELKEIIGQEKYYTHTHKDGTVEEYNLAISKYLLDNKTKFLDSEDRVMIADKYREFQGKYITGKGLMFCAREGFHRGYKSKKKEKDFKQDVDVHYDVLLSLFCKMYSNDEILVYMQREYDVKLSLASLIYFSNEYEEEITRGKNRFQNDITSIRLTHKASRLEQYQELFARTKELYMETDKVSYVNATVQILDKIKSEVEGNVKKLEIDINGNININHALALETQQTILSSMHIYDIIIARASSIAGKSPLLYIKALRDSFYADITGFGGTKKDDAEIRVSPSDFQYKLDELEKKYYEQERINENINNIPLFQDEDGKFNKVESKLDILKKLDEEIMKTKKRSSSFDAFYKGDI
jgi:hypothetical protein